MAPSAPVALVVVLRIQMQGSHLLPVLALTPPVVI